MEWSNIDENVDHYHSGWWDSKRPRSLRAGWYCNCLQKAELWIVYTVVPWCICAGLSETSNHATPINAAYVIQWAQICHRRTFFVGPHAKCHNRREKEERKGSSRVNRTGAPAELQKHRCTNEMLAHSRRAGKQMNMVQLVKPKGSSVTQVGHFWCPR